MVLGNLMKGSLTTMESGGLGGGSHTLSLVANCKPSRKRWTLRMETTVLSQQEENALPPHLGTAQPMRESHNSAKEKPLCFQLPVHSSGPSVSNSSQFLPFLDERAFLSFVQGIQVWFCHSFLLLDCNSLLFPKKLIFC